MGQMKKCNLCLSFKDVETNFISKRGKETKSCSACLYVKNQRKIKYRSENKDKVKARHHRYYKKNEVKINEYSIKYNEENSDKINKKFSCECGGRYTYQHKRKHERSKKHIKFILLTNDRETN
jgi:hypothetical protein